MNARRYHRVRVPCANPDCSRTLIRTEEYLRRVRQPTCSMDCRHKVARTPKGPDNALFKGRRLTHDGVVLIYVGLGHPLANRQGYAFEHRVIAARQVGRLLLPTDVVVHLDNDLSNNDPANLRVVTRSEAQRLAAQHRNRQRG